MSRVAIIGASGMTGEVVINQCLQSNEVSKVVSFVRRPTCLKHEKLKEVVQPDLLSWSDYAEDLTGLQAAFCCVGVYTGNADAKTFRKITTDIPIAFAEEIQKNSPGSAYCFLSGMGADPTEKSRAMFARDKGAAERIIGEKNLRFHSFRPGYIYPVKKRKEPNVSYRISRALYPLIKLFGEGMSITSEQLGAVMFKGAMDNSLDKKYLENKEMMQYLYS